MEKKNRIDLASKLTLAVTALLFILALFEKGFTHEMLLEAGVFLVSVKLVLAAQQQKLDNQILLAKIDEILAAKN